MVDFDAAPAAAPFGWMRVGCAFAAMHEAQQRNVGALLAANRTVLAGYQDVYASLVERCAARVAEARDRVEAMHGLPLDAGTTARHIAEASATFERAMADLRGLSEMAKGATADAFAILRRRTEEALAEWRAETNIAG